MSRPSLVFLAAVLSVDVTRILVSMGYGLGYDTDAASSSNDGVGRFTNLMRPGTGTPYPPLAITACTGAGVPIVVTTQYPHGVSTRGIGGLACIIQGVTGNTAANNISEDPRDRTVGLPQGVLAVPLTPTTLALYGQEQDPASANVGRLVPLIGNGAWLGGGTVVPALTDGSILLGRENVREHSAPPRIVMVPRGADWSQRSNSIPNGNRRAEILAERSQRSVRTKRHAIEFHCWGQKQPPDAAYDFDIAQDMADAVVDSAWLLFGQREDPSGGVWDDQKEREVQFIKAGHLFVFTLGIDVPVLDNALAFMPDDSIFQIVERFPSGEIAARIDVPLGTN